MHKLSCVAGMLAVLTAPAYGQSTLTAALRPVADEKAVFATVETKNVVPARARIGGTVIELTVRDGDEVTQGQTIALIGDDKLQLQIHSLDAQINGLKSQLAQAQVEFNRADALARSGAASRQQLDLARTAAEVANSAMASRVAERDVVAQQVSEGAVRAPTAGRVLQVPLTAGTVVLSGEPVAQIAESNFVLRLELPERHARFLHTGDKVRLDGADLGKEGALYATVVLVYPQIQNGRVQADATVSGVGIYFVGQRIRVWVAAGERMAFVVPTGFISSRFGLSYVKRRGKDGTTIDIPVQRGRDTPTRDMADGVEILSGLQAGDELAAP